MVTRQRQVVEDDQDFSVEEPDQEDDYVHMESGKHDDDNGNDDKARKAGQEPVSWSKNLESVMWKQQERQERSSSWYRLKQVLCYDGWVAVYIVLAVAWVIWQSVGVAAFLAAGGGGGDAGGDAAAAGDGGACGDLKKWIGWSIALGFLYMCLVFVSFGCSLICLR
jgi:hypothetical protein